MQRKKTSLDNAQNSDDDASDKKSEKGNKKTKKSKKTKPEQVLKPEETWFSKLDWRNDERFENFGGDKDRN